MTHLLDTDVIINHIKKIRPIVVPLSATLVISVITLGELLYGAEKSHERKQSQEAIDVFIKNLRIAVLPITREIITSYVIQKTILEKQGKSLEDFDLLIAATAIEHDLTLVTGNKKHFTRIPSLKVL